MANLPDSWDVDPTGDGPSTSGGGLATDLESASVDALILLLADPNYREAAIKLLLKKKREAFPDLALSLWTSFNTVSILLQEVTDVYKLQIPSELTIPVSLRVCDAISLLECVAAHHYTRMLFIRAKMPLYLYPFLYQKENGKPFEILRFMSLGVIGSLVKVDDVQVVHFLLESEMVPLCLRCMDVGCAESKAVATFILSKILRQEEGLHYCCDFPVRFYAVEHILGGMIEKRLSPWLLKLIISCYLRFSETPRACEALRRIFPAKQIDATSITILREDPETMRCLEQLFHNLFAGPVVNYHH